MIRSANGHKADYLKRQAKSIKKELGIPYLKALDKAAVNSGFTGWDNFLNSSSTAPPKKAKTITIGGFKGGVGKSTLAYCLCSWLANREREVLLIDINRNMQLFVQIRNDLQDYYREALDFSFIVENVNNSDPETIRKVIVQAQKQFEYIVIDTDGSSSQLEAMLYSDIFITPVESQWSRYMMLDRIESLLNEARTSNPKLKGYAFLNRADEFLDNKKSAAKIKKYNIDLLKTKIKTHDALYAITRLKPPLILSEHSPTMVRLFEELLVQYEPGMGPRPKRK